MRSLNTLFLFTCCAIGLSACEFKCSVGNNGDGTTKGKTVTSTTVEKDGTIITNNIDITAKGIKIKKATLLLPNNNQVPDDNIIGVNQKIKLLLLLDDGWKLKDGKASIGASEKLTASDGQVIVDAADLFSDYTETGIDPQDAKVVTLSAVITQEAGNVDYYQVVFRVWDKYGDAEINGSYKFYIK